MAGGVAEEAAMAFAEVTVARRLPEAAARVAGDAAPPVCAPAERVRRAPALVGVAARVEDDARDVGVADFLAVGFAAGTSLGDTAPPVCAPAERVRLVGVVARVGDDARDVGAAELLAVGVAAGTSLDLPRRGPGPTAGAGAVAPPSS